MYFTLIAYKPNSEDTCRGCLMASYSSDFILEHNLEVDALINRLAEIITYDCRPGEEGYETHYLPLPELSEIDYIEDQVADKVKQILAQRKIDKETAKLKKEEAERQKKTQEELDLLKKLQEKYK